MCPWHFVCYHYKPVLNVVNKIAYEFIMSYVLMLSWSNRYTERKQSKHLWCLLELSIKAAELYIVTFLTCLRTEILFVAFILTRFSRTQSEEYIAKSNIKFLSILFISLIFVIERKQWIDSEYCYFIYKYKSVIFVIFLKMAIWILYI